MSPDSKFNVLSYVLTIIILLVFIKHWIYIMHYTQSYRTPFNSHDIPMKRLPKTQSGFKEVRPLSHVHSVRVVEQEFKSKLVWFLSQWFSYSLRYPLFWKLITTKWKSVWEMHAYFASMWQCCRLFLKCHWPENNGLRSLIWFLIERFMELLKCLLHFNSKSFLSFFAWVVSHTVQALEWNLFWKAFPSISCLSSAVFDKCSHGALD